MLPVHTILFPTDFLETAQQAFPLACSLAQDCGARIVALHVVPPPVGHDQVLIQHHPDEYYEGALHALRHVQAPDENVRLEHRLEDGDAAEKILKIADEVQAGLIVMGTHGRTGLGRLLLGSVTEKVLRGASCPVVAVKKCGALKPRTILFPTDLSESSESALGVAFSLTRDHQARLIILHVAAPGHAVPYSDFEEQLKQCSGYRRELEDRLRQCQKPDCNAELRVEVGEPEVQINRVAKETACDLIVMGTHGRSGLRRLLMGSVAEKTLRSASCPVLLVNRPAAAMEAALEPQHEPASRV